ncbi:MAG TPA: alpha/beta hydrolase, partial [Mycobacterium sp.]|nr:alpha/beta hydrolase [Mycobacterium sp.]
MVDRFLVWLGAGMVTAGVAAGMVAGAGVAVADSPAGSDGSRTTSSESAKPTEYKANSNTHRSGTPKPKLFGKKPKKDADGAARDTPTAQQPETVKDADKTGSDTAEKVAAKSAKPRIVVKHQTRSKPVAKPESEESNPVEATAGTDSTEATRTPGENLASVLPISRTVKITTALKKAAATETAAVAFVTPANAAITSTASAPPLRGLLSAIGTIVFNLYGLAIKVVGGPPILPPNTTVTVRSSTLRIDCADGQEVPADWYIPAGAEENPPQRLIYLQHGFLAAGPWYSYTAATLAEQTNSIVVAPTITSNFLACDACWLGAPQMQE